MRKTRAVIATAALAVLSTAVSGCGSSGRDATGGGNANVSNATSQFVGTLHVAVQSDSEQVLFEAAGVDDFPYKVQWGTFQGVPNMVSAFEAGAVDVGTGGQAPIIQAQDGGHPLKIVATKQDSGNSRQLVARGDVKTVADLKGKTIATQVGTQTYAFIIGALKEVGLTAQDVTFVNLALADARTAFQAGKVDATAAPTSDVLRFQQTLKDVTVLRDQTGLGMTQSVVISSSKALADPKISATVGDFVARWVKAQNWIAQHPQQWVQAEYVQDQRLTADIGTQVLAKLGPPQVHPIAAAQITEQQELANLLLKSGSIKQAVDASQEYDRRFNSIIERANDDSGGPVPTFPVSFAS